MARHLLLIVLVLCVPLRSTASASGGSQKPDAGHGKKEDAGHVKKEDAGHSKKEGGGHGGGHGGEEETPEAPKAVGPKREYNPGVVMTFPSFKAQAIGSNKTISFEPRKGHAAMLIFIASWCEPCQALMPELKQLAKKYASNSTDVYFIFSNDTIEDATGFVTEHKIPQTSVMANVELLTSFKNPETPSVYIADQWGYLADRFLRIKKSDIDKIDVVMGKITAL